MLAALVLDILGVDPEVIVADYLITADRMELILGRYRSDPGLRRPGWPRCPPRGSAWRAATMVRFLDVLHRSSAGPRAGRRPSASRRRRSNGIRAALLEAPGRP